MKEKAAQDGKSQPKRENEETIKKKPKNTKKSKGYGMQKLLDQPVSTPLLNNVSNDDAGPSGKPLALNARKNNLRDGGDKKNKIAPLMSLALKRERVVDRYVKADLQQREDYYFSRKAGCAPSIAEFHQNIQHNLTNFPVDKNVPIYIDNKYNMMISSTSPRCKAWFIRVKSQLSDDSNAAAAIISLQSGEEEIREACLECVKNLNLIQGAHGKQERAPYSECSETYLKDAYIVRLEEPPESFPESIYYCKRCDFHISSVSHAKNHLENSSHFDDFERSEQRKILLSNIPDPSELQLKNIDHLLEGKLEEHTKRTAPDVLFSQKIVNYLKSEVFNELGHSSVEILLYGSWKYFVQLPDSDLNLSFMIQNFESSHLFDLLKSVMDCINKEKNRNAEIDDQGNSSAIIFVYEGINIRLCWYSNNIIRPQICFANLMSIYVSLRREVLDFLRVIRLWATTTGLDSKNRQHLGLPRYGFDIMSIHFLQQAGMIPVLHEIVDEPDNVECASTDGSNSDCSKVQEEARERRIRIMSRYLSNIEKIREKFDLDKDWSIGKLFIGFFKYYTEQNREAVVQITQKEQMTKDANRWNRKCLHLVDPFRGDNVLSIPKTSWPPYFFNCVLCTYVYFAIPRTSDGPVVNVELVQNNNSSPKKTKDVKKDEAKTSPTKLFSHKFDTAAKCDGIGEKGETSTKFQWTKWSTDNMISMNVSNEIEIDDAQYTRAADKLAAEEAEYAHVLSIMERCTFDGIPLTRLTSNGVEIDEHINMIYSRRTVERVRRKYPFKDKQDVTRTISICSEFLPIPLTDKYKKKKLIPQCGNIEKVSTHVTKKKEKICEFGEYPGASNYETIKLTEDNICSGEFFIRQSFDRLEIEKKAKEIKENEFVYEFEGKCFSNGYEMEMKCISCDGNHCVSECPPLKIPKIEKILKKRTEVELEELNGVIDHYYEKNAIPCSRLEMLKNEISRIQKFLRDKYTENVVLTLFGSVMSGIGIKGSDIDICLRFDEKDEPPLEIEPKEVILKVASILTHASRIKNVQSITTAKVPIVKFQIILKGGQLVDADISYYNILAIYNTRLLKQYTLWTPDNRFAKLGLFIKYWAKFCDIGDASKGSISSYAYIILLISYLQQCDPPVLPRLQEDFRDESYSKRIIENWDTYFHTTIPKNWQKNRMSCAQLLIGFFNYYATFDYRNFVIQCRREAKLSKLEKEWNKPLNIEDPFDLHHNLGSGVSMKMHAFICRTIIESRKVFMLSNVRDEIERNYDFYNNYRRELMNLCSQGHAPTDRQCHVCGRIGHFAEGCPRRRGRERKQRCGSSSTIDSSVVAMQSDVGEIEKVGDSKILKYHKRTARK